MRVRRRHPAILGLAALAAVSVGIATAAPDGNSSSLQGSGFTPSKLPKKKFEAGKLTTHLHTNYADAGNVGAGGFVRRTQLFFDDDGKIDTRGIPACRQNLNGLNMAAAMAACSKAKVGSGTAHAQPNLPNCVLLFNGPKQDKHPTLIVFTRVGTSTCGDPAHNMSGAGSFTLKGVIKKASGDYGTMLDVNPVYPSAPSPLDNFNTTVKRGHYVSSRCHDRNRRLDIKAKFTYTDNQSDTVHTSQKCKVKR
jgi:hypothetical protein